MIPAVQMGTSSERTHSGQRARARGSSSHALCFGLCSGSATPRESMTSQFPGVVLCKHSSQLVELSGSRIICFKQNPLSRAKGKENLQMLQGTSHKPGKENRTTDHMVIGSRGNCTAPGGIIHPAFHGDQVPVIVQL